MALFQTTRWSLVLGARAAPEPARRALDELCRQYQPPVLAFIRSHGHAPAAAEDLCQAFFESLLHHHTVTQADPRRGSFRTFLLTALKRFLANQHAFEHATKRGGGRQALAIDTLPLATTDGGPEQAFERDYALTVIGHALFRLEAEARDAGKLGMFEALREYLLESPDQNDYATLAERLQLRRNTLAVAIHRMRSRLRELVQQELIHTVDGNSALEAELASLRSALGRSAESLMPT